VPEPAEAVARRLFEGLTEGAVPEEIWAEDAVYREDPRWPGAGVHRGRDEIVRCFAAYGEVFEDPAFELTEIESIGDLLVITAMFRSHVGEMPVEHEWGYLAEVRDGAVQSLTAYFDPAEARRAAS
jgi:ketosteroid isomerase-like protein